MAKLSMMMAGGTTYSSNWDVWDRVPPVSIPRFPSTNPTVMSKNRVSTLPPTT